MSARPISLVLMVGPWDWPLIPWCVESWLPVVDDVLIAWEQWGRCIVCEDFHLAEGSRARSDARESLEAIAKAAGWRGEVRELSYERWSLSSRDYEQPFGRVEPRIRNLVSWCTPHDSLVLMPDVDERFVGDPEDLREWLQVHYNEEGRRRPFSFWAPYAAEVLAVSPDRGRVLLVDQQPPRRTCIGGTMPGQWGYSRAYVGERADVPVGLFHFRPKLLSYPDHFRDHHMGAGFAAWERSLVVGDVGTVVELPRWQSDANHWQRGIVVAAADLPGPLPLGVLP